MTGKELKAWRFGCGWSSNQAGQWFGVTGRTWRRWERAKVVPTHVDRRIQTAEALQKQIELRRASERSLLGKPVTREVVPSE